MTRVFGVETKLWDASLEDALVSPWATVTQVARDLTIEGPLPARNVDATVALLGPMPTVKVAVQGYIATPRDGARVAEWTVDPSVDGFARVKTALRLSGSDAKVMLEVLRKLHAAGHDAERREMTGEVEYIWDNGHWSHAEVFIRQGQLGRSRLRINGERWRAAVTAGRGLFVGTRVTFM
ncbi:MAG: hypothetical protein EOO74_08795, partial [Myxococcales bacterium]